MVKNERLQTGLSKQQIDKLDGCGKNILEGELRYYLSANSSSDGGVGVLNAYLCVSNNTVCGAGNAGIPRTPVVLPTDGIRLCWDCVKRLGLVW